MTPRPQEGTPEDKRRRLEELLRRRAGEAAGGGRHPLSRGQRALWLTWKLEPASWAYNAVFAARVVSPLDVDLLRRSLRRLSERHPVLRTRHADEDGGPVAVVEPPADVNLEVLDGPADPERRRAALRDEARRPFDLTAAPPFRVRLWRGAADDHHLLLASHHVAVDGWTMWMLVDELGRLYAGDELPPPPRATYADHVRREESFLAGTEADAQAEHWRRELDGAPPSLELPFDFAPRASRSTWGDSRFFRLDAEVTARLQEHARGAGATPFLVLLAVFQVLLARYAGQDEVVVGTPVAGRPAQGFDDVAGYFVNPLPIRGRLGDDPPFEVFLARLRDTFLAAHEHRDLPFPVLLERLGVQGDGRRAPLFQSFFAFQRPQRLAAEGVAGFLLAEPGASMRLGGLDLESVALPQQEGQFDVTLQMVESRGALSAQLGFDSELLSGATAERMVEHFRHLLAGALAAPRTPVRELPMMGDAERRHLLALDAVGDHPRDATLYGLFAAAARRDPGAAALVAEVGESGEGGEGDEDHRRETWTYGDLQRAAEAVAGLVAPHLQPARRRVAVLLPEGPRLVAALLGVLRAGGCFVCLDPRQPLRRLADLTAAAAPAVLLAAADDGTAEDDVAAAVLAARPASVPPPVLLRTDAAPATLLAEAALPPATPPPPDAAAPEDDAYVAFTSGSTGEPKGIVQTHASFCQFLRWQAARFAVAPGTRWAQWATSTYDAAYCEIFGTLCFGGTLLLAPPATRHEPRRLLAWLAAADATLLQTVPSFFHQVVETAADGGEETLRTLRRLHAVLLAGEVLPPALARRFFDLTADGNADGAIDGSPALYNLYGPTETVLATWHRVSRRDAEDGPVPVGRAIDGRQILVLDAAGRLAPLGVPGEIHVRSPHLTRGYLGRDEETRRAYVQNPLHDDFPDAVYRTGDLGRWRPGDVLEFRGRADAQVKVRGMRVELGEVEAVLRRHPAVADAAADVREVADGDPRLVAWVVAGGAAGTAETAPAAGELRDLLRAHLPAHMVPAAWAVVEALPRTATGKLDRRALATPRPGRGALEDDFEAPAGALEEELAGLWQRLLAVPRVGRRDDFFALGGHSLLANRLIHAVAEELAVELPLRALFEAPTLAAFAARVEAAGGVSGAGAREVSAQASEDLLLSLLDRVEEMSEDEAAALLAAGAEADPSSIEGHAEHALPGDSAGRAGR